MELLQLLVSGKIEVRFKVQIMCRSLTDVKDTKRYDQMSIYILNEYDNGCSQRFICVIMPMTFNYLVMLTVTCIVVNVVAFL